MFNHDVFTVFCSREGVKVNFWLVTTKKREISPAK